MRVFKRIFILIICILLILPSYACSKLADIEDGEDQIEDATKVANDYVRYVLDKDSESAKALTQEKRGAENDALGDILENMPYEQSNIVNKVFANTEYEIVDMKIIQDNGDAQGTVVFTMPDLPKMLESDEEYTNASFINAIKDAPKTEKRITIDLLYVDEIYSVKTSTVESMATFVLGIGYGDDYNFSLLTDRSALKCLETYIYYSQEGMPEEIIKMTEKAITWPDDYITNKYVNRFRQTYYSMMNCTFTVTERHPDQYVIIKATGYVPDMKKAAEIFKKEENLERYFGGYVYDLYYDKAKSRDGLSVQILFTIFDELIQELPMVEADFEVVVAIVDDEVKIVGVDGLEPDPYKYIGLNEINDERYFELMLKGTDYLYEEKIITDANHDYWYELIEQARDKELGK